MSSALGEINNFNAKKKEKKKSLFFYLTFTDHTLYQIKAKPRSLQQKHNWDPPQNAQPSPWQLPLFRVAVRPVSAEKSENSVVSVLMRGCTCITELFSILGGCLVQVWVYFWLQHFCCPTGINIIRRKPCQYSFSLTSQRQLVRAKWPRRENLCA